MSETAGASPGFAKKPGYKLFVEPSPKRIRVRAAGETLADSHRARLLHEAGHQPVYYLPREDARMDLFARGTRTTHCPFKGEATYYGLPGRENLVWSYERPYDEMAEIAGLLAFDWSALDERLEEDEPVFGHPRDPYHRIDVRESRRRVRVRLAGEVVADTRRALFLFETGLPTRYYMPPEDVRTDVLRPSGTRTVCPYKGEARYWSAEAAGRRFEDVAWSYPEPLPEQPRLRGRLCFHHEAADDLLIED